MQKEFRDIGESFDWLQVYGFLDGGYVSNIGSGFGGGTLLSAGGGFRAQAGELDFGLEAAVPLNEDRFGSGDSSVKFNGHIGMQF